MSNNNKNRLNSFALILDCCILHIEYICTSVSSPFYKLRFYLFFILSIFPYRYCSIAGSKKKNENKAVLLACFYFLSFGFFVHKKKGKRKYTLGSYRIYALHGMYTRPTGLVYDHKRVHYNPNLSLLLNLDLRRSRATWLKIYVAVLLQYVVYVINNINIYKHAVRSKKV